MARYRDVKTVSVHGNSFTGVQEVNCDFGSEEFEYSGDDNVSRRRIDITKRSIGVTIIVQDPDYKRDIYRPVFGASPQLSLNEVQRISMNERADEITDSAEDDDWIWFF